MITQDTAHPSLLTAKDAAIYMSLKPCTLAAWRVQGNGPKFVKLGKSVRYSIIEIDLFISKRTRLNTAQICTSKNGGQND